MSKLVVRRAMPKDEHALQEIATQAFNFPDSHWEPYPEMVGRENLWAAAVGSEIVGGMSLYAAGQWFHGRAVPMAGFALVMIAPEHRGYGYGRSMLSQVMHQVRQDGFPLAALYASTQPVYRKLGFEQAGNCYEYACSINDIRGCQPRLPIRRIDPRASRSMLEDIARQRAQLNTGCLDRTPGLWSRIWRELDGKVFSYVVGEPGRECGYVIYEQKRAGPRCSAADIQWEQRSIQVRDMVALNADAMESIWALLSSNRSVTEVVQWAGPAADPRCLMLDEHEAKIVRPRRWMLRLLDVRQALLQRGYPRLSTSIAFSVTDEMIEANNGRFTLRLDEGVPTLHNDAEASPIQITAQALAPLYSGLWTARQLHAAGTLVCDDELMVSAATRVFSTNEPWMPDAF